MKVWETEAGALPLVDENGSDVVWTRLQMKQEMDDHSQREEIQEARENGYGTSSRYSDTLFRKNSILAKRLSNGNVLRFPPAIIQ